MQTMYCRGVCNESIRNKGARNKGVRNKGVRDKGVRRKDSAIVSRYRRARVKCTRRCRKGENSDFYLLFTINMRQPQGSALCRWRRGPWRTMKEVCHATSSPFKFPCCAHT